MSTKQQAELALIAAVGANGVIGIENRLPWRLPDDLKRFKALTLGKPVLMGRKTWDSLGRPLPGRRNLVVTRQQGWAADGAEAFASIDAAVAAASEVSAIFVIGGGEIYSQALAQADVLYLTEVAASPAGDAHFPAFDRGVWREVSREAHVDAASGVHYAFVEYRKA
ncbi:dihydrofolate reductase [Silvimonas sp. JCM 19000]